MVDKNAISRVYKEQEGFQSQLFVVRKKDGGQRPIINLKKLNSFVQTEHFKMKGIHMFKDLLKPGDWMTKVNLKDAYFMIPQEVAAVPSGLEKPTSSTASLSGCRRLRGSLPILQRRL